MSSSEPVSGLDTKLGGLAASTWPMLGRSQALGRGRAQHFVKKYLILRGRCGPSIGGAGAHWLSSPTNDRARAPQGLSGGPLGGGGVPAADRDSTGGSRGLVRVVAAGDKRDTRWMARPLRDAEPAACVAGGEEAAAGGVAPRGSSRSALAPLAPLGGALPAPRPPPTCRACRRDTGGQLASASGQTSRGNKGAGRGLASPPPSRAGRRLRGTRRAPTTRRPRPRRRQRHRG